MTEFEIQRNLRAMNAPRMPGRDLWPSIAARIEAGDTATPRAARRRWLPLAAAASTVLAIAGSLLFFALNDRSIGPAESDGVAEKSVSSLLSKKPRTKRYEPMPLSMVVVIDTALPCASTMDRCEVPLPSWALLPMACAPAKLPGCATPMLALKRISLARSRR